MYSGTAEGLIDGRSHERNQYKSTEVGCSVAEEEKQKHAVGVKYNTIWLFGKRQYRDRYRTGYLEGEEYRIKKIIRK